MASRILKVEILGDSTSAQRALGKVGADAEALSAKTDGWGSKFASFGKKVAEVFTLGGIAVGVASLKMAGDFQAGVTTLVTGAGEAEKNIGMISAGILKMAVDVGTSTKQLTDGLFMIESAGYHGAAGLQVLKMAAEGAKVGNADLGVTANAVTTVMKDYHLQANQAADATNFLVAVVKQGKTHMEDIAGAISQILPIASSLHVPLADVGGALATLTSHGIDANKAATYLRFSIGAMVAPSKIAAKALDSIGLSSTDLGDTLQKKGLVAAFEQLQEHLNTKFPQGGAAAVATLSKVLGGVRGLGAALGLTGQNMAEFVGATKKTADGIAAGKGKVEGWALVQKDANFKLDQAKEVIQTLGIKIGVWLIPKVGQLAVKISELVDWLKEHQTVAIALAAVIGGVLVGAVTAWAVSLFAAGGALAFLLSPITLVIVGVAALAAGVIYAYTHFEGFRTVVDGVVSWLRDTAWPAIQAVAQGIADQWAKLVQWTRDHWAAIQEAISHVITVIQTVISLAVAEIQFLWDHFGSVIVESARASWEFIKSIVEAALKILRGVIQFAMDLINGDWGKAWDDLKQVLAGFWDGITAAFVLGWKGFKVLWDFALATLKAGWDAMWNGLGAIPSAIFDGIIRAWNDTVGHIPGLHISVGSGNQAGGTAIAGAQGTNPSNPSTFMGPTLPTPSTTAIHQFALGGIVPGGVGVPQLAIVHGGERVLTPSEQRGVTTVTIKQLTVAVTPPAGMTMREANDLGVEVGRVSANELRLLVRAL